MLANRASLGLMHQSSEGVWGLHGELQLAG
jgi:hypothetical protein